MFVIPRGEGIVSVAVPVPDLVVPVVYEQFRVVILGNLASDFDGFSLRRMQRRSAAVAFAYDSPLSVLPMCHVNILSHFFIPPVSFGGLYAVYLALPKPTEQAEAGFAEARVNQRQSAYRKREAENELPGRDVSGYCHVSVSFPIASPMRAR